MRKSLYTRPNKPMMVAIPTFDEVPHAAPVIEPKIIAVHRSSECHVTPADVASRMVEYLDPLNGDKILEPEAGTGNLISALIEKGVSAAQITGVEQHCILFDTLLARFADHAGMTLENSCFLEYAAQQAAPQFNRAVMNPPFKTAKKHIEAALSLLVPGGSLVALVPITFRHDLAQTIEKLPSDTFAAAKVYTKIIQIDP